MKTVSKKLLSLLLVAIMLVSAVPFQAFAAAEHTDDGDPGHGTNFTEWTAVDEKEHTHDCAVTGCSFTETNAHNFVNGVCSVCYYKCEHTATTADVGKKDATCQAEGYTGDEVCDNCGAVTKKGEKIDKTGHVDANGDNKCDVCETVTPPKPAVKYTLTLDAGEGTVSGGKTMDIEVTVGYAISPLPDAKRDGYNFVGWFLSDGTQITLNKVCELTGDDTATAKYAERTYNLTVIRVLDGDSSTAKEIYKKEAAENANVLDYLKNNVQATILAELAKNPGYEWDQGYWKNYAGTQPLIAQSDKMDQAQTVYVNFKPKEYTISFDANGGTVSPTTKKVTFGKAVGDLPTPTKKDSVFQGWVDANGKVYTKSTIYKVADNLALKALWEDQALVLLRIYINGNTSAPDRIIPMDGYVKNNNVTRANAETEIKKYYTAKSGTTMQVNGLYTEDTWASYVSNTSKAGVPTVQITKDHVNNVYVMLKNVQQGASSSTSTGSNSNGTTTGTTNPKTGDNAYLFTAATVMMASAAAFVTVTLLRKRSMI